MQFTLEVYIRIKPDFLKYFSVNEMATNCSKILVIKDERSYQRFKFLLTHARYVSVLLITTFKDSNFNEVK